MEKSKHNYCQGHTIIGRVTIVHLSRRRASGAVLYNGKISEERVEDQWEIYEVVLKWKEGQFDCNGQ